MESEGVEPEDPVAVAELHKRLVPYHTCREELGFATKAEYDVAMLELLDDADLLTITEPALREAVRAEIRAPEPGLGFLHRFAASEIRLTGTVPSPGGVPLPRDEPVAPAADRAPDEGEAQDAIGSAEYRGDATTNGSACRRCAAPMPGVEGARYCPSCGADQVLPTCEGCGAEVREGWRYCAFCGRLQPDDTI